MNAHQIDINIIIHPPEDTDRKRLLTLPELLSSLSTEPVNVHLIRNMELADNVFERRKIGYLAGYAPFVSYVDDDDVVRPGVYVECLRVLTENPEIGGVYTNSTIRYESGHEMRFFKNHEWSLDWHRSVLTPVHQTILIRRSVMEIALERLAEHCGDIPPSMLMEQMIFTACASVAPWKFLNIDGYVWYKKSGGFHTRYQPDHIWTLKRHIDEMLDIYERCPVVDMISRK